MEDMQKLLLAKDIASFIDYAEKVELSNDFINDCRCADTLSSYPAACFYQWVTYAYLLQQEPYMADAALERLKSCRRATVANEEGVYAKKLVEDLMPVCKHMQNGDYSTAFLSLTRSSEATQAALLECKASEALTMTTLAMREAVFDMIAATEMESTASFFEDITDDVLVRDVAAQLNISTEALMERLQQHVGVHAKYRHSGSEVIGQQSSLAPLEYIKVALLFQNA